MFEFSAYGKSKEEALEFFKQALVKMEEALKRIYSGSGDSTPTPDEPEEVFAYLERVLDNHLKFENGKFVITLGS